MSLKRFIAKLWLYIQSLFNGLLPELKKSIKVGVIVVENLKKVVDHPGTDILTAIIKGDIDDKIKSRLRVELPKLLISLKLAENCSNETDPEKIVACAVATLQSVDKHINNAFLHSLSILVAQVAADGKLTWSDGATILEWYYQNQKKVA